MSNEADHQTMAEAQNPLEQPLAQKPVDRFARIKHDARVLKDTIITNKARITAVALALTGDTVIILNTACGTQNTTPTPISTPLNRGLNNADYGLTPTPTVSKEDKTAGLMTVKEFAPQDIPADLSAQLKDKLKSNVTKLIGFEAHDPQNPDKSVPFYLIKADKNYVMFKNDNNQYVVDEYNVSGIVNKDSNETHVVYNTFTAKTFVDFGLGRQFKKAHNETQDDYVNRVIKLLKDKGVSPDAAADIFKDTDSVTITNPYTGASVKYSKTEQGVLAKIMDFLAPPKAYADSIQQKNEATPTPVKAEENSLIADLILKDMTIDELKKNAKIPRFTAITTEYINQHPIPKDIQDAFREVNPNDSVGFVGNTNRGLEMNAVITSKSLMLEGSSDRYYLSGFGANIAASETQTPTYMLGEFVGIVPIPNSNEFYIVLQNPINNKIMPVRVNLKEKDGNNTGLGITDFKKKLQYGFPGKKYRLFYQLLNGLKLSEFVKPGDNLEVFPIPGMRDENDILVARSIGVERFEGYEELKQKLDKIS